MINKSNIFKDAFLTFDIETTTIYTAVNHAGEIQRDAIIYSGQLYDGSEYMQARDLDGIRGAFDHFKNKYEVPDGEKIAVFVHFLSYEFQFIKSLFNWTNILARDERRIISGETDDFIFRCSFFLSNMSLRKFLESEDVPEEYQKTDLDFTVRRFPWTELTEQEKIYMRNDVIGLHLALQRRIRDCRNQDINFLPYTSTGYVRRMCRKAMYTNYKNILDFREDQLTFECFELMESAFRGGNTHCNRYKVGKVIENVHSIDIASSYPFEMLTKTFPMRFFPLRTGSIRDFYFFKKLGYAIVFTLSCKNIRVKENVYVPYIPYSKCRLLNGNTLQDNGRVLESEYLQIDITEIDYDIIMDQYDMDDFKISNCYIAKKKMLPAEFREVVQMLFERKCTLKGVDDYYYARSKALLNSMYGLLVTNPCKPEFEFINNELIMQPLDKRKALEDFYHSRLSFLSYQHGVYVTAYARQSLQQMIDLIGDDFIYCDTDSVKFTNYERHKTDIDALNRSKKQINDDNGISVRMGEKTFYLGVYEYEGCAEKFKSFGAKKYLYGSDDDFKITIAGIPKAAGADSIRRAVTSGKIKDPFDINIGFSFDAIKSTMQYNDYNGHIRHFDVDGHKLTYTDNIASYDCNYTLGYARDYEELIRMIEEKEDAKYYL